MFSNIVKQCISKIILGVEASCHLWKYLHALRLSASRRKSEKTSHNNFLGSLQSVGMIKKIKGGSLPQAGITIEMKYRNALDLKSNYSPSSSRRVVGSQKRHPTIICSVLHNQWESVEKKRRKLTAVWHYHRNQNCNALNLERQFCIYQ